MQLKDSEESLFENECDLRLFLIPRSKQHHGIVDEGQVLLQGLKDIDLQYPGLFDQMGRAPRYSRPLISGHERGPTCPLGGETFWRIQDLSDLTHQIIAAEGLLQKGMVSRHIVTSICVI
jgi:hypothetical protein